MNELSTEKKMTVKEVAEVFRCDERTIHRACNKLFPGHIKNGIMTYLNELQVTAIKFEIERHHNLGSTAELPETDLEMLILQKKLDAWKDKRILDLSVERDFEKAKRIEVENTNFSLMHVAKTYDASEIAKELGMRSAQQLNIELKNRGVQYKRNETWIPTAKYSENKYYEIKQKILDSGMVKYYSRFTQAGRLFVIELLS
jgi:AraC-like DNA-binding protein